MRRRDDDRGATLVEFALIVVPLAALVFAAIEFGWAYNQQQDVRYGARQGARIAAVSNIGGTNTTPSAQDVVNALCKSMDSASSATHVSITATAPSGAASWVGVSAVLEVAKPLQQVTGFYGWVLKGKVITSTVTFRIEQPPTWTSTSAITVAGGKVSGGLQCQ